jgi:hypothetical protein
LVPEIFAAVTVDRQVWVDELPLEELVHCRDSRVGK